MNPPTLILYTFLTEDRARLAAFVDAWKGGGVTGARHFCQRHFLTPSGDRPTYRLIEHVLSQVSYLALGYAATTYHNRQEEP